MATYGYIHTSRDQEPSHPGSDPEVMPLLLTAGRPHHAGAVHRVPGSGGI